AATSSVAVGGRDAVGECILHSGLAGCESPVGAGGRGVWRGADQRSGQGVQRAAAIPPSALLGASPAGFPGHDRSGGSRNPRGGDPVGAGGRALWVVVLGARWHLEPGDVPALWEVAGRGV